MVRYIHCMRTNDSQIHHRYLLYLHCSIVPHIGVYEESWVGCWSLMLHPQYANNAVSGGRFLRSLQKEDYVSVMETFGVTNVLEELKTIKQTLTTAFPDHTPRLFLGGDLKFLVFSLLGMACLNQQCCIWCTIQRSDWLSATYDEVQHFRYEPNSSESSLFQDIPFDGIVYCLGHLLSNVVCSTVNIIALIYDMMSNIDSNFPLQQWLDAMHDVLPDWVTPTTLQKAHEEGICATTS